jgi:hypothetical protein
MIPFIEIASCFIVAIESFGRNDATELVVAKNVPQPADQTEIADLDVINSLHEDIGWFEISVHQLTLAVDVFDAFFARNNYNRNSPSKICSRIS